MNTIVRNVLAVVAGWVAGSVANIALITVGGMIIPAPAGVNPMDAESLRASAHLFESKHFVFPFLAHAIGALVGGGGAALIAGSRQILMSVIVGGLFFFGGVAAAFMIPAPVWFVALDLIAAYIPMALLGWKLSGRG